MLALPTPTKTYNYASCRMEPVGLVVVDRIGAGVGADVARFGDGRYGMMFPDRAAGSHSTLADACESARDQLRRRPRRDPRPESLQAIGQRAVIGSLSARQLLSDSRLRTEVSAAAAEGKTYTRSGLLADAQLPAIREAVAIMRDRIERVDARKIAELAIVGVAGRFQERQSRLHDSRARAIAAEIADLLHAARPLYTSQYGRVNAGRPSDEVEWDRYSKKTKYPCKYSNAGAWVEDGEIRIADSRGIRVYAHRLTAADRRSRNAAARARQILGVVSRAALDAIGPAGEDDQVSIRTPMRLCRSPEGMIIVDHPTQPRVVQVVVVDSTTDRRHHLTVPPKYGLPLVDRETAAARVHAAIAWTFGLRPEEYAPATCT